MAAFNGKNDDETPWDGCYPPVKLTQLWKPWPIYTWFTY